MLDPHLPRRHEIYDLEKQRGGEPSAQSLPPSFGAWRALCIIAFTC